MDERPRASSGESIRHEKAALWTDGSGADLLSPYAGSQRTGLTGFEALGFGNRRATNSELLPGCESGDRVTPIAGECFDKTVGLRAAPGTEPVMAMDSIDSDRRHRWTAS